MDVYSFWVIEAIIAAFIITVTIVLDRSAARRVQASVTKLIGTKLLQPFEHEAKGAFKRGMAWYWLGLIGFLAVTFLGMDIYTRAVEPRAELSSFILIDGYLYGLVAIPFLICLGFFVARAIQMNRLRSILAANTQLAKATQALAEIQAQVGRVGVTAITVIAILASLASGATILIFLFMASQTAIECARSAKCI